MDQEGSPRSSLWFALLWLVLPLVLILLVTGLGLDARLSAWIGGLWG